MSDKFKIPAEVADTSDKAGSLSVWAVNAHVVGLRITVPHKPDRTAFVLRTQLIDALAKSEPTDA